MCHTLNEKWEKTNSWKTKLGNYEHDWRGKSQVLVNIGSRHHQRNGNDEKIKKEYLRKFF